MTLGRPPAFLVGEHLALDFVNTLAAPHGTPIEWLGDGKDFVDWLEQVAAIEPASAAIIRKSGKSALDDVARQAREFRKWLRDFVSTHKGKSVRTTAAALEPLNELLSAENSYECVDLDRRCPLLRRVHRWESPQELLQPIASAAADLICHHNFRLIRECEGSKCVLIFLDRTKAHSRRWCSMAVCGNRAKAAAHRARKLGR